MGHVLAILAVAFAAAFVWHFLKPAGNLWIDVRGRRVEVGGPALSDKSAHVTTFLRDDMTGVRRGVVRGSWDGRSLRLSFHGDWTPAQRQRLRNFLLVTL